MSNDWFTSLRYKNTLRAWNKQLLLAKIITKTVNTITNSRLQMKLLEGNVFTGVCLSTGSGYSPPPPPCDSDVSQVSQYYRENSPSSSKIWTIKTPFFEISNRKLETPMTIGLLISTVASCMLNCCTFSCWYQVHLRDHTSDKPYQCPHCEAKFKVKSCMKDHVNIHTGAKPYLCNICGQCILLMTRQRETGLIGWILVFNHIIGDQ